MSYTSSIKGLQEARAAVLKTIEAAKSVSEAVRFATLAADRYAVGITPVDTGSWRAAQRPEINGLHGRVSLDPNAVNPKSGSRPAVYAAVWDERGGRYAVYARTVNEAGQRIVDEAGALIYRGLP